MSVSTRILQRHPPGSSILLKPPTRICATPYHPVRHHQFQSASSQPSPPCRHVSSSLPSSCASTSTYFHQNIPFSPLHPRAVETSCRGPSNLSPVSFSAHFPLNNREVGTDPDRPPDDRKVKLGKTLRILQTHLPTLLQTPLPQEVLSPHISLHLFPSTHPHLPTVTGRVAYVAALWTSPIAWNRVPIIGNVKLEVLSERMVKQPPVFSVPRRQGAYGEQLVVRWRTVGKGKNWGLPFINNNNNNNNDNNGGSTKKKKDYVTEGEEGVGREKMRGEGITGRDGGGESSNSSTEVKAPVGMAEPVGSSKEFTGLFIFDFDKEGRILSHTIEHVQEGGQWEKGVGAKVVGLTDWLLGGMKGGESGDTCPAFSRKDK